MPFSCSILVFFSSVVFSVLFRRTDIGRGEAENVPDGNGEGLEVYFESVGTLAAENAAAAPAVMFSAHLGFRV